MNTIEIRTILADQKKEFENLLAEPWCYRSEEELVNPDSRLAQVVIGVRRSGKSVLCLNVIKKSNQPFAYVNFEDERLVSATSEDLNAILECLYQVYGDFNHIFLDEIQNIEGWQYFVNRLLRVGMHVLMTGSNAKLLSSELATHMTGRHMEIELYPFSFSEWCIAQGISTDCSTTKARGLLAGAFEKYLREGGFPELIGIDRKTPYVDSLVKGIIENDIERRFRIQNKATFEKVAYHILNIVPAKPNSRKIAEGFGLGSHHTVEKYEGFLTKAYLTCSLQRYSSKSASRLTSEKLYPVDVALMDNRTDAFAMENLGWRLETIIFIELLRRYRPQDCSIAYFEERQYEVDFVVCKGMTVKKLIQVCYDISNPKTRQREIRGLVQASQKTNCNDLLLITAAEQGEIVEDGKRVIILPAYMWLSDIPEKEK